MLVPSVPFSVVCPEREPREPLEVSLHTPLMTRASFTPPPSDWTLSDLAGAVLLDLGAVPLQPGATALVTHLSALVAANDPRKRRRSDLVKLHRAVGAVVGGALRAWRKGRAVFRSREHRDFTGELVGNRSFIGVVVGLVQLDFLAIAKARGYAIDFGDGMPGSVRWAARLRPTPRLLDLATEHGIGPDNVRAEFGLQCSEKPPKVPAVLVERRPLKTAYGGPRTSSQASPVHSPPPDDDQTQRLSEEVCDANQFAAGFDIAGCLPPRWWRPFGPSWRLGGRWTALGRAGMYQALPTAARAAITVDGKPTVEVDIHASHLSIMHGLLGLPLPEGDLYAIPGLSRAVVKRWIVASLGKGSAVGRRGWPRGAVEEQPELRGLNASEVGAAIMARYPFLADPAEAVAGPAGLHELAHIGTPSRLLTHRLMGLEAAGISAALAYLRHRGVPALPVHDSLIVPAGDVRQAGETLRLAFEAQARVSIRTKVDARAGGIG